MFDDPIEMTEDAFYFASVISEYEAEAELTVLAQLNSDTDNSTGRYSQAGDGSFVWFTSQTSTPAVRLITSVGGVCNDPLACNFSAVSGACEYDSCAGCIDPTACNYDASATISAGGCDFSCLGCTDPEAVNWDEAATTDDGSCQYFQWLCDYLGDSGWEDLPAGLFSDSVPPYYVGQKALGEWVLSLPATVAEPSSGSSFAVQEWSNLVIDNLPPGMDTQGLPNQLGGSEQVCITHHGIPLEPGIYGVRVSRDLTLELFGNPYVIGQFEVFGSIEVLQNPNPVMGCTYDNAANFSAYAT